MTRIRSVAQTMATLAGGAVLLSLGACGGGEAEPAPEPSETPADANRSIFDEDGPSAEAQERVEENLPPLETIISFADGTDELTEAAKAELATVVRSEQVARGGRITLGGHSDAGGSDAANERASQGRAEAVRDFLVENGLDEQRIVIIAFGEQNPIEPNALENGEPNEAGRAANRRVEITVQTAAGADIAESGSETREQTLIETLTTPTPNPTGTADVEEPPQS